MPIGRHQIDDPHVQFFRIDLQDQPAVGMQRREVFEVAGVGDALGIFAVDGFDAEQREVSLAFLGRTDLPLHHVAVAQPESANLRRADVNVIRAGKIVVFRAAQEAEAVGKNFEHAFAVHQAVLADARAKDLEDQVLLLEPDVILDPFLAGDLVKAVDVHDLQILDEELPALDLLVLGIGFGVERSDIFRPFVGAAIISPVLTEVFPRLISNFGTRFATGSLIAGTVVAGRIVSRRLVAGRLMAWSFVPLITVAADGWNTRRGRRRCHRCGGFSHHRRGRSRRRLLHFRFALSLWFFRTARA